MRKEACGKCKWWDQFNDAEYKGTCQKNPPVVFDVNDMTQESSILINARWPITWKGSFCGQFEEKEIE